MLRSSPSAYTENASARGPAAGTRLVSRASCLSVVPLLHAGEDLADAEIRSRDDGVRGAVIHADALRVERHDSAGEDRVVEETHPLIGSLWLEDRFRRARQDLAGVVRVEQQRAHRVPVMAVHSVVELEPALFRADRDG